MNKLAWLFSVIALLALPLLSKAQSNQIMVTYEGYTTGAGALRVSTNTGSTHDYYTYPSSYGFATGFTKFKFDWSHGNYPGWGSRIVTVNKSVFDAQAYGTTTYHNWGSTFRYQVTKDYGYSTTGNGWMPGTTYNYVLKVKVYDPRL
jgi:hypothetical protein